MFVFDPANGRIPFFGQQGPRILGPNGLPLVPDTPGADGFTGDGFILPHVYQQAAILSGAQKTYLHDRWDEARKNSRENALAMERDCFLQGLLQERKLACATLKWHIEVDDEKDPYQKALKDGLQRILADTPYLIRHHYAALDATWYGRHGVQHQTEWKEIDLPAVQFQPAVAGVGNAAGPNPSDSGGARPVPGESGTLKHERPPAADHGPTAGAGQSAAPHEPGVAGRGAPAVVTTRTQKRRCQVVKQHQPVHGDSIAHKWDGTPYILVYSPEAKLYEQQGAEITLTTAGSYGIVLRQPYWRERFIIHSHESVAAEFFDPERAEAIFGVGVRDRLYWIDWIRREFLEWVTSFFERVGLGVTVWYFEGGSDRSFQEVQKLAQDQSRRANILVPQYPARTGPGVGGMERLETPVAGAEAMLGMIRHLEEVQERYVNGQTGSSRSETKGLGTHDTSFMRDTKHQITKYDAENLGDTYSQQWVDICKQYSFPELQQVPARWKFNIPDPEAGEKLEAVSKAISFGVTFKTDEVRALTGLSQPEPGDETVGGMMAGALPGDADGDGVAHENDNKGKGQEGKPPASVPVGSASAQPGTHKPQGATPPQGGPHQHDKQGGWITIGGHAEGDKKHAGGTPIQLGEGGQIQKGPAALQGQALGSLSGQSSSAPAGVAGSASAPPASPAPATPAAAPIREGDRPAGLASLRAKAAEVLRALDSRARESVAEYTGNGYKELNRIMRDCPTKYDCFDEQQKDTFLALEAAIAQHPPFEEPIPVYRGLRLKPETKQQLVELLQQKAQRGEVMEMPSLTSTTYKPEFALESFSSKPDRALVFHVQARQGLPIESVSLEKAEGEILLSSRARFRVLKVQETPYYTAEGSPQVYHITYLEQVS